MRRNLELSIVLQLFALLAFTEGQRVAPGVPPQQYQPPPPQQGQYQQPNQQYQQPHGHVPQQQQPPQQQFQQQQQVPQQQFQQPPPAQQNQQFQQQQQQFQQQPQQQQPGGGHGHHAGGSVLNAQNMAHEKEHMAEHLDVPNLDTSKMSEQELQFHYFKMHDSDNNNMLDGCELIKSLIHWHAQGHKEQGQQVEEKIFAEEELQALIDPILSTDDSNRDGYIDYPEFIRAQQKAAAGQHPHQQNQ